MNDKFVDKEGNFEYKSLCDYSNDELYEILCANESIETRKLVGPCCEVLKRIIEQNRNGFKLNF